MWSAAAIADALIDALMRQEQAFREEHAVYGLDSMTEVELHPILAAGLERSGFGVLREQAYPHEWRAKTAAARGRTGLPEHRDRRRCDLVLTPEPGSVLDDALVNERERRKEAELVRGSLFEDHASAAEPVSDGARVPPEEAYWLEIKLVNQFCVNAGVPGPNRAYTSELTRHPVADLAKLAADDRIRHGGVAIVLCAADEATARHDLGVMAHKCLDRGLSIESPIVRVFPMQERIGNAVCAVGFVPLRAVI